MLPYSNMDIISLLGKCFHPDLLWMSFAVMVYNWTCLSMLLVPIFYILSYLKSKSLSHLWDFGTVHTAAILIASIFDTCLQSFLLLGEQVLSGSVEAAALRDFGFLEPSIPMESCVPLPGTCSSRGWVHTMGGMAQTKPRGACPRFPSG